MIPQVAAETFPPRYRLHKYWGKKPANVIRTYVEAFTEPGGLVLDPFMGCGVSVAEACVAGRRAIGVDLNPIAVRIARTRLRPVPEARLDAAFEAVARIMDPIARDVCKTTCKTCGCDTSILSTVWERDEPVRIKTACGCPARALGAGEKRHARRRYASDKHPDAPIFFGWQMRKLARAGLERFSDLFTSRNLFLTGELKAAIDRVEDRRSRDLLLVTFTANLAQCTRMIADYSGAAGGPSWKLNSYWVPKVWQELDPWHYFKNRYRKTRAAMVDMRSALEGRAADARIYCGDSSRVLERRVEPGSVDFVFTDPPYGGEGIQYGELSMLWNLWLGSPQNMKREVAFNPVQDKDERFYRDGLLAVFRAVHRALAPHGKMAVTFNNKDPEVWAALLGACESAGFSLLDEAPLSRSAPAVTEKNAPRAPKTDVVLLYERRRRRWIS